MEFTDAGRARLAEQARRRGGFWTGPRRREEWAARALRALHLHVRDRDYLVRDGRVEIIDQSTGRVSPDRSWEQGLHQMIEVKEGCTVTAEHRTRTRISFQRFFRRYLRLAGMTGTAREVARELWSVYALEVVRIPTRRPCSGARSARACSRASRRSGTRSSRVCANSGAQAGRCWSARARWPRPSA